MAAAITASGAAASAADPEATNTNAAAKNFFLIFSIEKFELVRLTPFAGEAALVLKPCGATSAA